jgi:hypothetical protein
MRFKSGDCVNARANESIRRIGEFIELEASSPRLLKCRRRRPWKSWKGFDCIEFSEVQSDSRANCIFERVGADRL